MLQKQLIANKPSVLATSQLFWQNIRCLYHITVLHNFDICSHFLQTHLFFNKVPHQWSVAVNLCYLHSFPTRIFSMLSKTCYFHDFMIFMILGPKAPVDHGTLHLLRCFAPQAWSLAPGLPAHICMNSSLDSFNLSARGNQPTRPFLLLSLPKKQGSSKPSALLKHGAGGCSRSHIPIGSNVLQKFLVSLEKAWSSGSKLAPLVWHLQTSSSTRTLGSLSWKPQMSSWLYLFHAVLNKSFVIWMCVPHGWEMVAQSTRLPWEQTMLVWSALPNRGHHGKSKHELVEQDLPTEKTPQLNFRNMLSAHDE